MIWDRNTYNTTLCFLCFNAGFVFCSTGCSPPNEPSTSTEVANAQSRDSTLQTIDAVHRLIAPKDRLRQVFQRYQGSAFYEDDGEVILTVRLPGKPQEQQRAPLKVRLDRGQLAVDAYATRVRVARRSSSVSELVAWFDEPQTSNFDSQVLMHRWDSQPGVRVDLDRVLQDEILRSRLSAGLAGPPPQLEWLLASSPMEKLFSEDAKFRWLDDGGDSASNHNIEVRSDGKTYVFSIDPATSLIRQVELPVPNAQQPPVEDNRDVQISITVVLHEAAFQTDRTRQFRFVDSPDFEPVRVRQFVAIPPSPPSSLLGRNIDPRVLRDALNRSSNDIPVDRWLVLHAPTDLTALPGWIAAWKPCLHAIEQSLGERVPVLAVTDNRRIARSLQTSLKGLATTAEPDDASRLIRSLRLASGSMAMLSGSGEVLLIQESTVSSTAATTLAALRDSLNGIDVPARVRDDYERLQQAYQTALKQVSF